jgi:hypothetical protein
MTPDASWPNISDPLNITPEDHARHTERPGVPYPGDLLPGHKSTTMAKTALKFVNKPHSMKKRHARPMRRRKNER